MLVVKITIPVLLHKLTLYGSCNGSFHSGTDSFPFNGVIASWQVGIPLIKQGGKIKLIIPPYLGYGCTDYSGIPGNSVLVFDVEMLKVK